MEINIINPAAGKGASVKAAETSSCQNHYFTKAIGDAEIYLRDLLKNEESATIHVYGGDGTLNEVINGIMHAQAAERTSVSIHPVGTGNDFHRNLTEITEPIKVDLICCNDRYAINMLNIGFDCRVVSKMAAMKKLPFVKGTGAYILGVLNVLMKNHMEKLVIDIVDADGKALHYDGQFLLSAIGNGAFCGGGFKAAACADISDGILDMIIVQPLARRQFVGLIGDYKAGTHICAETMAPAEKFKNYLDYVRCRKISISGFSEICLDGEVVPISSAEISVLPRAVTFIPS